MKVVLNLATLTEADTLLLASTIITDLPGNPGLTPDPTIAALTSLRNAAQSALNAVAAARQALTLAVTNKDAAFAALRDGLTDEAATVEAAADELPEAEQAAFVEGAGMQVQRAPSRVNSLDALAGLALSAGDLPGTVDWHCDPVPHARFYVVEYTTEPVTAAVRWLPGPISTKSSGTLAGLVSGAAVSVRVHAEGTRGVAGAPGVAGQKIVP